MKKNSQPATTLYQEMCLSTDQGSTRYQKVQALRVDTNNNQKKHSAKTILTNMEGEQAGYQQRTCLIDEWMEKKRVSMLRLDNDLQFSSSSSSSSHSSSPGFTSSDHEPVQPRRNKESCFPPIKQKQIRTSNVHSPISNPDQTHSRSVQAHPVMHSKSKSAALKMYADLKKTKLPISPGGKLTRFINSIFNGKQRDIKAIDLSSNAAVYDYKSKSQMSYTCSSASSSTRSCLVKKSPTLSSDKSVKKSVRFYPSNIEYSVDIRSRNAELSPSSAYARKDESLRFSSMEEYKGHELAVDEDDSDDAASDTSSELFEIDHIIFAAISSKSNGSPKDELPVFETTNVNSSNRAITNAEIIF